MDTRSSFTVEVPLDETAGSWLLFNTLRSSLAELNAEGYATYKALVEGAEADTAVAETLREGGFLVAAADDERAWLHERTLQDMNDESTLELCIAPTLACNLHCIYCYEEHEAVAMSPEVVEGVKRFVQKRYDDHPFRALKVIWYGGEPMLAYGVIGELSRWFIEWCDSHEVTYEASMVSNATLIDESAAADLVRWGVRSLMPTLDGLAEGHDRKRVTVNGGGSFEATLAGVRASAAAGMTVSVNCNLEQRNGEDYRRLRELFADDPQVNVYASQLRNYHGWCEQCSTLDCEPSEVFLSRSDYARELFELYRETEPEAAGIYQSLRPRRIFCRGQLASYFVIDPAGDVTQCDGFMGDAAHKRFNVCDEDYPLNWPRTETPWDTARCRSCAIVPLCQGDCQWEWSMFPENCSALRSTLGDYVRLLRSRFEDPDAASPITLYLPARPLEDDYAEPLSPFVDAVMGL